MEPVADGDEDAPLPDALHLIVPAVVAKLTSMTWLPQQSVPTMAGAQTAAALGGNCYQWRKAYGPWHPWEPLPWAYTALLLTSLIDLARTDPGSPLTCSKAPCVEDAPA